MRKIHVPLGAHSYDIFIGQNVCTEISSFCSQENFSPTAMLIVDENVTPLYAEDILDALRAGGLKPKLATVPAGEVSKSLPMAENLYTQMIEEELDRKSPIIALGGGVTGDLAGFIAATYMRGVPFVQVPTSLLAAVDSSVGGKVAVNHILGKNLIGAFYQPQAVFVNLSFLKSLPMREVRAGLGEIIKYGVIYDPELFAYLEAHTQEILDLQEDCLTHIVARCVEIKAEVVAKDERENGLRRILNFGHTTAHVIEKETHYIGFNHGEAVAIGMLVAGKISAALGLCKLDDVKRIENLLHAFAMPTKALGLDVEKMYADTIHDKKAIRGKVHWILMTEIGKVIERADIEEAVVKKAMKGVVE